MPKRIPSDATLLRNKERSRAWYLANKELVNQRAREHRTANPELARKHANAHYQKNRVHKVAVAKIWIAKNKQKLAGYTRKSRYDITPQRFQQMWDEQKGLCSICEIPLAPANLDHEHDTKKIRALLCGHCNRGLGHFRDNTEIMQKAIIYVKRYKVD